MSEIVLLNKHQKKAFVIELYKQGKTRRQIAVSCAYVIQRHS
jgi:hypothetical protein